MSYVALLRCLLLLLLWPVIAHSSEDFQALVDGLKVKSFDRKAEVVTQIGASDHERATQVLEAFLEGDLYYRRKDDRAVIALKNDAGYEIFSVVDGSSLGQVGKRKVKRISINNSLRSKVRALLAQQQLQHPDESLRLQAVSQLGDDLDSDTAGLLQQLRGSESSDAVRSAIDSRLALYQVKNSSGQAQLDAIEALSNTLDPAVRAALNDISNDEQTSAQLRSAAAHALRSIDLLVERYRFVETVFFGLSLGSILVLAAVGLAITFGVMGVINMAHGELMMLGAYTTYVIQSLFPNAIEYSLLMAVPAAFLVAGAVGIAIERGVIRFLYGRPLETLLATFGVSLILQQAVRSIFSPLNRSVITPEWMSGSLQINSVLSLTYNRLYILLFTLLVFLALVLIMRCTRLGLQVRAVSQNRSMARAMGIRSEWVDAMTFGLGSGIAGVAGVALSQLTNVGPNLGQAYIVDSFMVVVFGGVGNLWGTLVSGLTLGVVNKFLEPWSGAVMAKILILVFIILFIQKRPRGLFPQKGRAAES